MDETIWLIISTVIIVLGIAKFLLGKSSSSSLSTMEWPVGPKKLPIIGNLHQLGGDVFHVVLANLAKVYGSVFTIWVGSWRPMIIVSDIDKAWEVLVNKSSDYSARDMPDITKIISANWKNISCSDSGPFWHNLRKGLQGVALTPLNVASQYHLQERDMKNLINSMYKDASRKNGILKPLDYLKEETVRLLSRLIFGQDFQDEKLVVGMHHALDDLVRISGYASLADAFKFCENLPSHKKSIREVHEVKKRVENLIRPHIVSNPPTNTYLYFLKTQDFNEDIIISAILEVYDLGVDSTASTTVWALTFLVREQEIQEKLYREIVNVTGGKRSVKVEDVNKMPYLQAVMKETMRMKPIAPMAIPHKTSKDTSLMGKKINKGSVIMVNLYAIHHNPKVFPEPYKFMPERFLKDVNSDESLGNIKTMESSLLAFSAGMRICAGMELGKLQLAFGLASLVHEFKWSCSVDGKLPDLSEDHCFILLMKNPLEAKITCRIH
uniref:Cheilanthifoline synthase n=1 Tax=Argemone mexicana TaxID=54796 RepID=C719E_ARGME|nr:RecName: Full=Cheilanthifoline synthase; Short=CHS; AltName: Full=Cytochrome P450 719A14 [Argemone mexicana]ABR14722.1 cheilanthifoline synthase [Argemone mexicana]ANY58136.1 CYP719A14 [synthetic construct]